MISSQTIAKTLYSLSCEGHDAKDLLSALVSFLESHNQLHLLRSITFHFEALVKRDQDARQLSVASAYPLSDSFLRSLANNFGVDESSVSFTEDPSLIGGFIAHHNYTIYDASVRTHLRALRRSLMN